MKDIRKEKVPGSNPGVGSKFNSNICLHLLGDFPPQKCARKCSSAHVCIPTWVCQAIATGTTFIGVGETVVGGQSVRRVASCLSHGSGREASGRRRSMHPQRGACSESIKSARAARPADRPVTPTQPPS